jgi:hypothetical protein
MPKLSEIDPGPNDILLDDVPDDVIAVIQLRAEAICMSFGDYVLALIADHAGASRETVARPSVILLDPE